MSFFPDIRQVYQPLQPTVLPLHDGVVYAEFLPDNRLRHYIYCYWQLYTTQVLHQPFLYRVVADGCIDIFFHLANPHKNFIMGMANQYAEFSLGRAFHYVGIRFLPTMFPQAFGIAAAELSHRYEELRAVVPAMARFIEQSFHERLHQQAILSALDTYFLSAIATEKFTNDTRLYAALHAIFKSSGVVVLEKEMDVGLSHRQLRRLFHHYVGDTTKTFCKIVRFQTLLRTLPLQQQTRKDKAFFDWGYYDQAHFIKEFKRLYGAPPSKIFAT